ncbi:MAG: ANTAR domain-containing response regulator [Pseudomonadota bacterium]|nr:ANTAR domain-containing response regulator [Pseudomonadota bacterium]
MTTSLLSVLVVDENPVRAAIIQAGLREAGHERVTVMTDVNGIARKIVALDPDVIVIDLGNPNRDMLESVFQLTRSVKRPIAMFVDRTDRDATERAIDAGVSAYVVDGLKQERIKPILDMAISRFNAYSRLERELEDARDALRSRRTVEQAKSIIMRSRGMDEDEAYQLLRRTAMNQNRKIGDVAQSVIISADLLGGTTR